MPAYSPFGYSHSSISNCEDSDAPCFDLSELDIAMLVLVVREAAVFVLNILWWLATTSWK